MWMKKFRAPILLNMKFNFDDLHAVLIKSLPEEIWNPEDIANSAMALDCITTVSEDFFSRNDRFRYGVFNGRKIPTIFKKLYAVLFRYKFLK